LIDDDDDDDDDDSRLSETQLRNRYVEDRLRSAWSDQFSSVTKRSGCRLVQLHLAKFLSYLDRSRMQGGGQTRLAAAWRIKMPVHWSMTKPANYQAAAVRLRGRPVCWVHYSC